MGHEGFTELSHKEKLRMSEVSLFNSQTSFRKRFIFMEFFCFQSFGSSQLGLPDKRQATELHLNFR